MRAYGEKFNSDPRVEFIDIGSFGTWGEAHTSNGSNTIYPNEVIFKHIALHAKYFPDKYIMLNDDMIGHRSSQSEEDNMKIVEYAKTLGCGARDDSVCVAYYSKVFGYDTLRTPYFYDHFWEDAPVDLEFEHYTNVTGNPNVYRDGFPFVEALRRVHATYAGFHGLPRPWLEKYFYITEYLANRLGYWYFIDGLRLTYLVSGTINYISVIFENRGFAHSYNRFELKIKLKNKQTGDEYITAADTDNRRWKPGVKVCERIKIDARMFKPGCYELCCGLFEGVTPILIAMQPERKKGDWYYLADTEII
jgi:hypothetical protein